MSLPRSHGLLAVRPRDEVRVGLRCPRGLALAGVAVWGAAATQCVNPNPRAAACLEPRVLCGENCVDLDSSDAHCGVCGYDCPDGESCHLGVCSGERGPAAGGAGGAGGYAARFTVTASLSATIGTVGIVEWSVDVPIDSAHIDFGRDAGDWEYRAPVADPVAGENRTLLLGMKPSTTYAFQIAATGDRGTIASEVFEITTDPVRNGLPKLTVAPEDASLTSRGFTISCGYGAASLDGSWITILDADGEYVWWYRPAELRNCSRARLSYDGSSIWAGNANVRGGNGLLLRVPMDGSEHEISTLAGRHHDFLVMPDETIVTIEYEATTWRGCDVVTVFDPATNESRVLYEVQQADPDFVGDCHSNAINWWPDQELFTLSVMNWNSILAFTRAGELEWIFGGVQTDFSGAEWSRQHQHHLLGDTILLLNNDGTAGGADVLEYQLHDGIAELLSRYPSSTATPAFGDVKRLPNDNILVTYSNSGVIREISPTQDVVREIATDSIGYTVRRASLYGPPPPFAD